MDILSWVIPIPLLNLFVPILTGGFDKTPYLVIFPSFFLLDIQLPFLYIQRIPKRVLIKIQCTHTADLLHMEMVVIAKVRKNIVLDLAAWQRWARASRPTAIEFYRIVRFILDMVGPRLMFASDWSGFPEYCPYRDWVKAFTEIPG
jgi:predicted TIM-barrel fold metal-dependent hydrolase